jgi:predicted ArsR family transcriptional regulator
VGRFTEDQLDDIDHLIVETLRRRETDTADSIARLLGYGGKTVTRRLHELRRRNKVVVVGRRESRKSGTIGGPLIWRLKRRDTNL